MFINAAAAGTFFCKATPIPRVLTEHGKTGIILTLSSCPSRNILGKRLIPRLLATIDIMVCSSSHENRIFGFMPAVSKVFTTSLSTPLFEAIKG